MEEGRVGERRGGERKRVDRRGGGREREERRGEQQHVESPKFSSFIKPSVESKL